MTKSELSVQLAEVVGLTQVQAEKAVATMLETITAALKAGDRVALAGFGIFETRSRAARKGVNPQTRQEITIPAATIPVFKPSKVLKDACKQ